MGLFDLFFGRKKGNRTDDTAVKDVAYLAIFSTSWCGPSKRFIKEINEAGINNYAYIDAEKDEALAEKFSVKSVPTIFLLDKNGSIIKKWVGYDDEDPGQSKFVNFIKNYTLPIIPYNNSVPGPFEKKEESKVNRTIIESTNIPQNNPSSTFFIEDKRTVFYKLEDIKYRSIGNELMLAPYDFELYLNQF